MEEKLEDGKIIPIKFDKMFCEIFNNKNNIYVLEEFIADYFNYDLKDVRGNVEIDSRLLKKREYNGNKREVDLKFRYKGELRNIEISTGWDEGIINRNVIYLSDIHSSQKYKKYKDIKQTIQINLLAFSIPELDKIKTELYLCDPETGYIITKKLRMDIIDMEKGKNMCYNGEKERNKLIKWCKIFMSDNKEEFENALNETLTNNSKERLLSEVLRLSGDDEMVYEYQNKTKEDMERESFIDSYNEKMELLKEKEQSVKEKEQLLDNKKLKLAKNLFDMNVPIDEIIKITDLTKEKIEEIK